MSNFLGAMQMVQKSRPHGPVVPAFDAVPLFKSFAEDITKVHPGVEAWIHVSPATKVAYLIVSPLHMRAKRHTMQSLAPNGGEWLLGGNKPCRSVEGLTDALIQFYRADAFQESLTILSETAAGAALGNLMTAPEGVSRNEGEVVLANDEFTRLATAVAGDTVRLVVHLPPEPSLGHHSKWETAPEDEPPARYLVALGHVMFIERFERQPDESDGLLLRLIGKAKDKLPIAIGPKAA